MTDSPGAGRPRPFRSDYHMHTKWSGHATGEMRDYVETGVARGLAEIGFSVHMPITIPFEKKLYLSKDEMPLYIDEARRLQDEFAGRILILIGGECDYAPGQEDEIETAISAYPFDYMYGAIHFIDGWSHDNPECKDRWETGDVAAIYRRYYELLCAAARSGFYDIVSHFDLVKKFGYRPQEDVSESEEAAAEAVARAGMAVEINTSGFDKPAREQYPSESILRRLCKKGVPVCFGSDAHAPHEVARHFDRAYPLAHSVGWRTLARFQGRRRFEVPLTV